VLADAGWTCSSWKLNPIRRRGAQRRTDTGYVSDLYSAFYPMSVVSPAIRALHLEEHGLRWSHAPAVVGHPPQQGPTTTHPSSTAIQHGQQ